MAKIFNLHRLQTANVGDLMCAPYLYFPEITGKTKDEILGFRLADQPDAKKRIAYKNKIDEADMVIVGGGGLLEIDFFKPFFDYAKENRKPNQKWVIWGAGHNSWSLTDWRDLKRKFTFDTTLFDLIGVRDYGHQEGTWVPCVSCMHPVFEKRYPIVREVGVYAHSGTMMNPAFSKRLPQNIETIDNSSDFETAVKYIAGCEIVLTDSFHGAYWATLLGRRVVAFPSSSKFYDMKHKVPLCAPEDWELTAKLARHYFEALEECRAANIAFKDEVAALIDGIDEAASRDADV